MEKQMKYSDSERLTHFLDGELPESQAGDLLEKVASDGALQKQYLQEKMINNTARSNGLITPPPFLKDQTMQKLGFTAKPPMTQVVKKYAWVLAALLLVSVTTTSIFLVKNQNAIDSTSNNDALIAKSSDKVTENIPVVTSEEISESNDEIATNLNNNKSAKVTKAEPIKAADKPIIAATIATDSDETDTAENNQLVQDNANTVNLFSSEAPANKLRVEKYFDGANFNIPQAEQKSMNFNPVCTRCPVGRNELQIKGLNLYSNNMMTQGSFAVAYLRNWNSGLKIGLELSFENISKVSYNSDTQTFGEPQELFSPAISAVARYDIDRFTFFNIHPYAQVAGGFGMNANYVYGGGIGLEYSKLYLPISFQLSYDYKSFNYYYGGTSNNSDFFTKHGFALGVNYTF